MNEVLTKKKKYVAPSVEVLELETTQIHAGSGETNSTPTVNGFQPGGSLGTGDMGESTPARRTSIWD
ncbi:MAG: hypothetical protein V8T28_00550 [Prevotellaceae bacterium]